MALLYDSLTQISDDLFEDLDNPTDVTVASITAYLRANIGNLNILINKSHVVNDDQSVSPAISQDEAGVLKAIYLIRYYNKKILGATGAAGYSPVLETKSDGFSVRFQNSNELAKFWLDMKRGAQTELDNLCNAYKIDKVLPGQIAGDDNFTRWAYPSDSAAAYVRGVDL